MLGLSFSAWLPMLAALVAGVAIPFQGATNAVLGRALGHPLWATVASLSVSVLIVLPALLAMRVPAPNLGAAIQGPIWWWLGGVAGVIYVTAALVLTPRMGAGGFIVAVIAGQMLASMLIDHFGWIGLPVKPVTMARLVGVGLILAGMGVVQLSGRSTASTRAAAAPAVAISAATTETATPATAATAATAATPAARLAGPVLVHCAPERAQS